MTEHPATATPLDNAPKSVRIAAVCEREVAAITAQIDASSDADGRTRLLRERADIRRLLAFAVKQEDYSAWAAPRAPGVDQSRLSTHDTQ